MTLDCLKPRWDAVVIGGGITGAGIFSLAASRGLSVLLVEQRDFAWGTSSRSSKMVHGGLRYLRQGQVAMTRNSVKERQRLLAKEKVLITPLSFLMPLYRGQAPSALLMETGLMIYSLMAMKSQYRRLDPDRVAACMPGIRRRGLTAGFHFQDAQVDDARLVLKEIQAGMALGGSALNYTRAAAVGRGRRGQGTSLALEDAETGRTRTVETRLVINATGAWAESLQPLPRTGLRLRPLRGSHLVFPGELLPGNQVLSFIHPRDGRPVFVFPWEGRAVVGTTDVDHDRDLSLEPSITGDEAGYLMAGGAMGTGGGSPSRGAR